ncbi:hypothetical protein NXS19_013315 [Fusarium pseudograminearum]|nr:hypothetical protein NXS19_013315 [Fusarium pseudograminearum]
MRPLCFMSRRSKRPVTVLVQMNPEFISLFVHPNTQIALQGTLDDQDIRDTTPSNPSNGLKVVMISGKGTQNLCLFIQAILVTASHLKLA